VAICVETCSTSDEFVFQEVLVFLHNFKKKIGDNYSDDDLKEFVKNTLNAGQVMCVMIDSGQVCE